MYRRKLGFVVIGWTVCVCVFGVYRVRKLNLSGSRTSCGSISLESETWSGSPDWTFTREVIDQSRSCWGWRPAPQLPFRESHETAALAEKNYTRTPFQCVKVGQRRWIRPRQHIYTSFKLLTDSSSCFIFSPRWFIVLFFDLYVTIISQRVFAVRTKVSSGILFVR